MTPEMIAMREPEEPAIADRLVSLSARYIHFGPFQIDQQRQEVTRSGSRLKLQGKVYQILLALIEKPGEVVTREELRAKLWPADTHVNYDANVNTTVNKLRQALGDSSDKPLYIETIPRKGYSLLVATELSDKPGTVPFPQAEATADSAKEPARAATVLQFSKSDIWVILGVLGLILVGMLLGAGITGLWMKRIMQETHYPLMVVLTALSRLLLL
jgi:DNA-binding winged helix-turn-helix (wHTH) protein